MNIDSEVRQFEQATALEKARVLARFLYELTLEARNFYGKGGEQQLDLQRLRFLNEIQHSVTHFIEQVLIDDPARISDANLVRLLLAPRSEKTIEGMMSSAWTRTVQAVV
jgi:hypothetical protein